MRAVINISLPQELSIIVTEAVASGRYATKSEFFRVLLRQWQGKQLVNDIEESEKEYAAGKGKRLKSLRNLR